MMKKKKHQSLKSKHECMKKKNNNKIVAVVDNKSDVYHISEDLIIEILLRLPPTCVLRFKQVCKTWYSLITNPDFLRTHSYSSLQFYKHTTTDDEELSYFSMNIPLKKHPLLKQGVYPNELLECCLINSCNGLLLLRESSSSYYVCNPMIKHYVKIPNITITEKIKVWHTTSFYILFDPTISLSYKLIRCFTRMDRNGDTIQSVCEFFVYSSEVGSWRHLISFPSSEISLWRQLNTAVLLNGIFYWKALYNGDHLVCFDLKQENVWLLALPPNPIGYGGRICFYFGECDGRLRLIEKYFVSHKQTRSYLTIPCSFDIMETEPQQQKDGNQLTWSVKYHVNINNTGLAKNHPSMFRIIQLYKTKKKNEEALLLNIHGRIVPFNLENNTFGEKLRTDQNTFILDFSSCFSNVCPYITTTLLPLL